MQIELDGIEAKVQIKDPTDHIQRHWSVGSWYEPALLSFMRTRFNGWSFVDVGAHQGNHTLWAHLAMRSPRVVAIEPEPSNYAKLCINLAANGFLHRTETHEAAAGRERGRCRMVQFEQDGVTNSGMYRATPGDDVWVYPLSELVGDLSCKTVLKIDVEGMEQAVITGAGKLLVNKPALVVETDNPGWIDQYLLLFGPYERYTTAFNATPTYVWTCASQS